MNNLFIIKHKITFYLKNYYNLIKFIINLIKFNIKNNIKMLNFFLKNINKIMPLG